MDLELINSRQESLIIHADTLRRTVISRKELTTIVIDVARRLDVEIKEAHKNGAIECNVDLPITFDVSNMKNGTVQRHVYFNILKWLEWRKYRVRLSCVRSQYTINIKWINPEDEQYTLVQMNYIRSKMRV
jgi:hypothetical protein